MKKNLASLVLLATGCVVTGYMIWLVGWQLFGFSISLFIWIASVVWALVVLEK